MIADGDLEAERVTPTLTSVTAVPSLEVAEMTHLALRGMEHESRVINTKPAFPRRVRTYLVRADPASRDDVSSLTI